jgi:hypothetical protein
MCFALYIVPPGENENAPTFFFQKPFFRLVAQGQSFVAIFFILLGYVNSLKPIQLSRAGKVEAALSSLASSTFRRSGRLVLPAAAITTIAWFLCQLHIFHIAQRSDAFWLQTTSPSPSSSWYSAFWDLARELVATWGVGENKYDQPQWALIHLFKGSIYVFMTLLATVNATPQFRLLAVTALYIWSWSSYDGKFYNQMPKCPRRYQPLKYNFPLSFPRSYRD